MSSWVSSSLNEYLNRQLRNVCWYSCGHLDGWSTYWCLELHKYKLIDTNSHYLSTPSTVLISSHSQKIPATLAVSRRPWHMNWPGSVLIWKLYEILEIAKRGGEFIYESGKKLINWSTLDLSKIMMTRLMMLMIMARRQAETWQQFKSRQNNSIASQVVGLLLASFYIHWTSPAKLSKNLALVSNINSRCCCNIASHLWGATQ